MDSVVPSLVARAPDENGIPAFTDPWPVKDIVYVSIVGTIMLAALLEWVLWILAFQYCLIMVFKKATGEKKISTRILAIVMSILFIAFRAIFLPIMVVTLPLPSQVTKYFPKDMVSFLQWFAFWSFAGLLMIPWLFCVYQLVTHNVGRSKLLRNALDAHSAPKIVVLMPCYKEEPDVLMTTIESICGSDYPDECIHIFLSFDNPDADELYLKTIDKLNPDEKLVHYPVSIDVIYKNVRITVSRFEHGGKRHTQKMTYTLINKVYSRYLKKHDDLFVLFIDSDCILDEFCIQNFLYEMELKPGSKKDMMAMTGVITSTTDSNSLITLLQDMEYVHGQLFERTVESGCGAVTCLPGALTVLRFNAFNKLSKPYFADDNNQHADLFDFAKAHLGEDRWLTHLFMVGSPKQYLIQMNTAAFCKTEAVQSFRNLLKQRRRWFLGFISNEACMITDIRLWKRYPLLCVVRFCQNTIRTTALLFFIMVIALATTSKRAADLPIGFIGVSLGLNWVLMIYFSFKLGRRKLLLYPLMFIMNPLFNWLYLVYGIFTAGQRTWGGPRAGAPDPNDPEKNPGLQTGEEGEDPSHPAGQGRWEQGGGTAWHTDRLDYTNDSVDNFFAVPNAISQNPQPESRNNSFIGDTSMASPVYLGNQAGPRLQKLNTGGGGRGSPNGVHRLANSSTPEDEDYGFESEKEDDHLQMRTTNRNRKPNKKSE